MIEPEFMRHLVDVVGLTRRESIGFVTAVLAGVEFGLISSRASQR